MKIYLMPEKTAILFVVFSDDDGFNESLRS